jgi:hypothetical protein
VPYQAGDLDLVHHIDHGSGAAVSPQFENRLGDLPYGGTCAAKLGGDQNGEHGLRSECVDCLGRKTCIAINVIGNRTSNLSTDPCRSLRQISDRELLGRH